MQSALNPNPEICVIGSGPAGLAVALRAAAGGKSVLLVESGDGASDLSGLNAGEVVDAVSAPDRSDALLVPGPTLFKSHYLVSGRTRAPGGCSTMWCVRARTGAPVTLRIARPERVDFEAQEHFEVPAWPVDFEEIDRYLDHAWEFFGLRESAIEPPKDRSHYALDARVFERRYFHFPNASVVHEDRLRDVTEGENIDLRTGCTLLEIETNSTKSKVTAVTFVDSKGERFAVAPKKVVLATGGVENARILLNAVDEGQLADPHDTLGRWFMDHPHARLGVLIPDDDIGKAGRFHDFHERDGQTVLGHYSLSRNTAHAENLLRFSMTLVGAPEVVATKAAAAGARLAHFRFSRLTPVELAKQLVELAKDARSSIEQLRHKFGPGPRHHTALGGWSDPDTRVTDVGLLAVESMTGQRPSRDNRVRLGPLRNSDGKRQACLQWSWSQPELDSYWRSVELAREHFERIGVGTFVDAAELGSGTVPRAGTGWHQMGGTRMSQEPSTGVVDADCRHHQTENLFIAGSSVFPSSVGYANPTLTLVALALRLGDHLA
ncbi:MAG: GMC family oxidoreductase [Polyangiales bacterium]